MDDNRLAMTLIAVLGIAYLFACTLFTYASIAG